MLILRTRQCRLSAAMMSAIPLGRLLMAQKSMTIGNAGQMSSIFSGHLGVQRSRRFRRRGESSTTNRHRWTRGLEYAIRLHQHQVGSHKSRIFLGGRCWGVRR